MALTLKVIMEGGFMSWMKFDILLPAIQELFKDRTGGSEDHQPINKATQIDRITTGKRYQCDLFNKGCSQVLRLFVYLSGPACS